MRSYCSVTCNRQNHGINPLPSSAKLSGGLNFFKLVFSCGLNFLGTCALGGPNLFGETDLFIYLFLPIYVFIYLFIFLLLFFGGATLMAI